MEIIKRFILWKQREEKEEQEILPVKVNFLFVKGESLEHGFLSTKYFWSASAPVVDFGSLVFTFKAPMVWTEFGGC